MKKLDHLISISLNQLNLTKDCYKLLKHWVRSTGRPYAAIIEQLIRHAIETGFEPSTKDLRLDPKQGEES